MDRVAQRVSAARLARRFEYESEVAARAAQRSGAEVAPAPYGLPAGRAVVRATDGRDYAVLPPLAHSHPQCEHGGATSTVELDPAKGCVISRSSHVDPCAHRPRLLLEIDRTEVSKTTRTPQTTKNSTVDATQDYSRYQEKDSGVGNPKKCCKGSSIDPLTDWCSSRPKVASPRPDCVQPSVVERIKRRSNNAIKEVRKIHTAPTFLSQNVTQTEQNKIGDVTAKVKADAHKLIKMLNDRDKLKEAGRGRNTNLENPEEASASGQLELRAPAGGAGVRVRVSLLSGAQSPGRCGRSVGSTCDPVGANQDLNASSSHSCDSWLSIKNIQKKLTGCRKDSPPIANNDNEKSMSQKLPTKEKNVDGVCTPCRRKVTQKRSPCQQSQQSIDSPCHTKEKEKPKPPPSCGSLPASRCSAHNIP